MAKENWFKKHPVWIGVIGVFLLFILIGIFGGGSDTSTNTQDNQQIDNTFNRILSASNRQVLVIEDGLIEGITISNMYSIKSEDFDNVYFVGGLLNGAGLNNEIGIWATGGYDSTSMIFSINGIANQFSDYPLGKDTDAGISMADDGAPILESYLKTKK